MSGESSHSIGGVAGLVLLLTPFPMGVAILLGNVAEGVGLYLAASVLLGYAALLCTVGLMIRRL